MKQSTSPLDAGLRKVLAQQALISMATIAGFALLKDPAAALSSAFGAVGAIAMTALLALRIRNLDRRLRQSRTVSASTILPGVAVRLLLVSILFWFGISVLDLAPLPMLTAFALTYLGYVFNFIALKN